jgi:hypothetical protein
MDVGAVDGRVTTRGPAGAAADEVGVIDFADEKLAGLIGGALHLHVALEAKIIVAFGEKLAIYRAVRIVAGDASFAQGLVLIDERARLLAMTFRALLIHASHREAVGRLHDFVPVWVVTLHAIHPSFDHWMMLRQIEERVDVEMALKAGAGILARIYDEATASAADFDMFAGGTVTGLAAGHVREFKVVFVQLAVGAGGEGARNICMTLHAGSVADVVRAFDVWRGNDGPLDAVAGDKNRERKREKTQQEQGLFSGWYLAEPARHLSY